MTEQLTYSHIKPILNSALHNSCCVDIETKESHHHHTQLSKSCTDFVQIVKARSSYSLKKTCQKCGFIEGVFFWYIGNLSFYYLFCIVIDVTINNFVTRASSHLDPSLKLNNILLNTEISPPRAIHAVL